jgi:methionyl-tRNA formyltransferase
MRFAITASDRYIGIFQAFLDRGWTPLKLFTTPVDQRLHRNTAVIDLAQRLKIDAQISRMTVSDLEDLARRGCEALIVASYSWRIGDWRPHLRYAVNFHPSPLPRGRGPYPVPAAILAGESVWGVACHKLEREFDSGDVLRKIEFPLSPSDDHDTVDLRIQLAARRLAAEVAERFVEYWDAAIPQVGGSYTPMWKPEERVLDFGRPVEEILRRLRAFGPIECCVMLDNRRLFVRRAVGWTEAHAHLPGTVIYTNSLALVIAARDGFIGLTEWTLIEADAVTGTPRR